LPRPRPTSGSDLGFLRRSSTPWPSLSRPSRVSPGWSTGRAQIAQDGRRGVNLYSSPRACPRSCPPGGAMWWRARTCRARATPRRG